MKNKKKEELFDDITFVAELAHRPANKRGNVLLTKEELLKLARCLEKHLGTKAENIPVRKVNPYH